MELLREYVFGARPAGAWMLMDPGGKECRFELRVRGFDESPSEQLSPTAAKSAPPKAMPVTRLTYRGSPPSNQEVSNALGLNPETDPYLYITPTAAMEANRFDLTPSIQHGPNTEKKSPNQSASDDKPERALRFDRVLRLLMHPQKILTRFDQRVCLLRGIQDAIQDERVAKIVRHDATPWLDALSELEQRGEDLTEGLTPELREQLTNPSLGDILVQLQTEYRAHVKSSGLPTFEDAARNFLRERFKPPPLVVMEGFTYLTPLQRYFVQSCLSGGARVVFLHPQDPNQPEAFAVMDRTYAPYQPSVMQEELPADLKNGGTLLWRLQTGLFAETPPTATDDSDESVTLEFYHHRNREVAQCLKRVKHYLDEEQLKPEQIAIVSRNGSEYLTILQEEARRLGLQHRLRVEPRVLLLTPLGRFALTLYEIHNDQRLEIRPDQFETMLLSGWLGADVQGTVDAFNAAHAQLFERCRTLEDWNKALAQPARPSEPYAQRLPSGQAGERELGLWRRALKQIKDLCDRLFDGQKRTFAEHIRKLRDELTILNRHDLRKDERDLVEQIVAALEQVMSTSAIPVNDEEFGEALSGVAREYQQAKPDDEEVVSGQVWVTTPEGLDGSPRQVVFYLGLDSLRVPRPVAMTWPFFELKADEEGEKERYFFLTVVRAAKDRLHLSYAQRGEDRTYGPSPYLVVAAKLLGQQPVAGDVVEPPSEAGKLLPPLALPGLSNTYMLHDVALFRLCPFRARFERFDQDARRFRDAFQLKFFAQGVWLESAFEKLVGKMPFSDAEQLRQALYEALRQTRPEIEALFPAMKVMDWKIIRQQLKTSVDGLVNWLGQKPTNFQYGVAIEHTPETLHFVLQIDSKTVTVETGLVHVLRIGKFAYSLHNALTHQHWLMPAYRDSGGPDSEIEIDGVAVFTATKPAVEWWRKCIRAALGKDSYPDTYAEYQLDLAKHVRAMHDGRFPKNPGDHCELCPLRTTCLGVPD